MKTYIKPKIEVADYNTTSVICLSMTDEETDEALGNKRGSFDRKETNDTRNPWKDGLW